MHVRSSCFAHKTNCFLTLLLLLSSSLLKVPINCKGQLQETKWTLWNRQSNFTFDYLDRRDGSSKQLTLLNANGHWVQQRRPWKRPWKIYFASFHFFFAIIPEMVEFIGLPFPFLSKLKIWSFPARRIKAGTATKCTKKRDARADLLFAH